MLITAGKLLNRVEDDPIAAAMALIDAALGIDSASDPLRNKRFLLSQTAPLQSGIIRYGGIMHRHAHSQNAENDSD